jgi:RimJ/RimL family protein N-acetyltransferase
MPINVTLREIRAEDLPTLFENQRDKEAVERAVVPARNREEFDAHWKKTLADPANLVRAIDAGGALAGFIGSWTGGGERQVGYWLGRSFWGQGIATQALRQLLLLEKQRPLYAHVARGNPGSTRVLEKCGFVFQSESELTEKDLKLGTPHPPIQFVDLHYRLDA